MSRYVYDFAEGDRSMAGLLGGKGANLAEMTRIGLPVPPGFTITTEACRAYLRLGSLAAGLVDFLEVMVFPAITGKAGYAALFKDGPDFDLDLVESAVLDGRTLKLVYVPHLHTPGIPEGVGPQRREG